MVEYPLDDARELLEEQLSSATKAYVLVPLSFDTSVQRWVLVSALLFAYCDYEFCFVYHCSSAIVVMDECILIRLRQN